MGLIQAKMIQNNISELTILNDKLVVEKKIKDLNSIDNISCYRIKIDIKKIIQRFIENKSISNSTTKSKYENYVNSTWLVQIYYLINLSSLGIFFFSEESVNEIKSIINNIKTSDISNKINTIIPIEIIIPKAIFNYDTYDAYYQRFDKILDKQLKNSKIKINKEYRIRNILITTVATVNPIIKLINVLTYILKILNNSVNLEDAKINVENFLKNYAYNLGYINDYRIVVYKNSNTYLQQFNLKDFNTIDEEYIKNKKSFKNINYLGIVDNTIVHKFKTKKTNKECYGILYKYGNIIKDSIDIKDNNINIIFKKNDKKSYYYEYIISIDNILYDYETPKFKISFLDYIIDGDINIKDTLIKKQFNFEIANLDEKDDIITDDEFSDEELNELKTISNQSNNSILFNTNFIILYFIIIFAIGYSIINTNNKNNDIILNKIKNILPNIEINKLNKIKKILN